MKQWVKVAASLAVFAGLAGQCMTASADTMNAASSNNAAAQKLMPLVGRWICSDTGSSKPYTATVKVEGAWIVWRDTGEDSNTLYVGWNSSMRQYIVTNLTGENMVEVSTTGDNDPLNATWHVQFPTNSGGPTFALKYSGVVFSLARPFVNRQGKRMVARLRCQKQP